ncbi:MAG: hypothetical protein U5R48_13265 [Gammaproteobacteria bacterium]|nr:hypothetical protein [Gammaproteobacteria bacterium]
MAAAIWEPELDSLPDDIDIDEIAAGRDVLVLRTALDDGVSFTGRADREPAQSFVDLPAGCTGQDCDGYAAGTVVIASDCLNTAVFMLTDSEGQPGQNRMLLEHGTGTTIDESATAPIPSTPWARRSALMRACSAWARSITSSRPGWGRIRPCRYGASAARKPLSNWWKGWMA